MSTVSAVESVTAYTFTVTDGTEDNTYIYEWGKDTGELTKTEYLAMCKRESLALAQWEIDQKKPPKELEI